MLRSIHGVIASSAGPGAASIWDISAAAYASRNFYVGSQEGNSTGNIWDANGTRFFITGFATNKIYTYSVFNPWLLDGNVAYTGDSTAFAEVAQVNAAWWKPDGTKLYVLDGLNATLKNVYQYSASLAFNILSLTYDNKFINVGSTSLQTNSISFSGDGINLYVTTDNFGDNVFQYTLSTAWDVPTASYSGNAFSFASQDTSPTQTVFQLDGARMFMVGDATNTVYQYDLGTNWDVSTTVYNSVSFSVSGQMSAPTGMFFKPDGTKMFVSGNSTDRIFEYTL